MRKSEIVMAIMAVRTAPPLAERTILKRLSSALKSYALLLDAWDEDVETSLAQGIIKHVGSVRGDLAMQEVIRDIDIILKRISCDSLSSPVVATTN